MNEKRRRHCWECLRRRLVCDSAWSGCKRCSASGIPCPGYSDTKPSRLKWLAPGRVTSRNRRPKETVSDGVRSDYTYSKTEGCYSAVIPHFRMRTEQCHLAQAAEYCKCPWRCSRDIVTYLYRQHLRISRPSSRPSVRTKSTHIPYHSHTDSTGRLVSRPYTAHLLMHDAQPPGQQDKRFHSV